MKAPIDDKMHTLLVEILAAQVLTMQTLMNIEAQLGGRVAGEREQDGSAPEPRSIGTHP